jgi:hypothetical protein
MLAGFLEDQLGPRDQVPHGLGGRDPSRTSSRLSHLDMAKGSALRREPRKHQDQAMRELQAAPRCSAGLLLRVKPPTNPRIPPASVMYWVPTSSREHHVLRGRRKLQDGQDPDHGLSNRFPLPGRCLALGACFRSLASDSIRRSCRRPIVQVTSRCATPAAINSWLSCSSRRSCPRR